MAKKKRSSKKKQSQKPKPPRSKGSKNKAKDKAPERQSVQKVLVRLLVFLLVASGIFYLFLDFAVGKNALWKVFVVVSLPYINLLTRKQFFEAPSFFGLLQPKGFNLGASLGAFAALNGLCLLLLQLGALTSNSKNLGSQIVHGIAFVLNPVFGFALRLNVTTVASFKSLPTSTLASVIAASLLFYYGCAVMVDLEKNHDPAKQQPLHMLPM